MGLTPPRFIKRIMRILKIFFFRLPPKGGCFDPLGQNFPTQQPTASPLPVDPKLPTYPPQYTPASQAQFPPELAALGPQGLAFGAPRATFPGAAPGLGLRPGVARPQGIGTQLRLSPNQLRLQLQQRLQGPQQVGENELGFPFTVCSKFLTPSAHSTSDPFFTPSHLSPSCRTEWQA